MEAGLEKQQKERITTRRDTNEEERLEKSKTHNYGKKRTLNRVNYTRNIELQQVDTLNIGNQACRKQQIQKTQADIVKMQKTRKNKQEDPKRTLNIQLILSNSNSNEDRVFLELQRDPISRK